MNFGSGECTQLWFVGLKQSNLIASLIFYGSLLIAFLVSDKWGKASVIIVLTLIYGFMYVWLPSLVEQHLQEEKQQAARERLHEIETDLASDIQNERKLLLQMRQNTHDYIEKFPAQKQKYETLTTKARKLSTVLPQLNGSFHTNRSIVNSDILNLEFETKNQHHPINQLTSKFKSYIEKRNASLKFIRARCSKLEGTVSECNGIGKIIEGYIQQREIMKSALNDINQVYRRELVNQQNIRNAVWNNYD